MTDMVKKRITDMAERGRNGILAHARAAPEMTRHAYVLGRDEDDCKVLFGEIDRGCHLPPEAYVNDLASRGDPRVRRPAAAAMLRDRLVRGDHLIVLQLADLGTTLGDVVSVVDTLLAREVRVISVRDRLDTAENGSTALRALSASLVRAAEQIGQARTEWQRTQGRRGGRPSKLDQAARNQAIQMRRDGLSIAAIVRELGVSRTTVYNVIQGAPKGQPESAAGGAPSIASFFDNAKASRILDGD